MDTNDIIYLLNLLLKYYYLQQSSKKWKKLDKYGCNEYLCPIITMNITTSIKAKVARIDTGEVFTYDTLSIAQSEFSAAAKALSRMVSNGVIKRYKNGMYYKPKQTVFGELKPREDVLLKKYLFDNDKQIAYVTGVRLYNQLGLTTQVPNVVRLASKDKEIKTKIGSLVIKPAKSYVPVTKKNVPLLQLLDVMKDFKNIPDMDKKRGIDFLKEKIDNLSDADKEKLASFAKAYPPKVRALLGAILETLSLDQLSKSLKETINYLSSYEFGISEKTLPAIANWNIT
jgi:predicted transcriptional regulator of viral defense system